MSDPDVPPTWGERRWDHIQRVGLAKVLAYDIMMSDYVGLVYEDDLLAHHDPRPFIRRNYTTTGQIDD